MKPLSKKTVKNAISINATIAAVILLIVTIFFELAPLVQGARTILADGAGVSCDCDCIRNSRSWYGRVNQWLWFWLAFTPFVIFSVRPDMRRMARATRTLFATLISYIAIIAAAREAFQIANAPFFHSELWSDANALEIFKSTCFKTSDGEAFVATIAFGWIPAIIYAGWWEIIWCSYHTRKTKLIDALYKRDWLSKIVGLLSIIFPVLIACWLAWQTATS